jgi:hypothetical protein
MHGIVRTERAGLQKSGVPNAVFSGSEELEIRACL